MQKRKKLSRSLLRGTIHMELFKELKKKKKNICVLYQAWLPSLEDAIKLVELYACFVITRS